MALLAYFYLGERGWDGYQNSGVPVSLPLFFFVILYIEILRPN